MGLPPPGPGSAARNPGHPAHCRLLRERLLGMRADYQHAPTTEAPERILLDYLARRTGRSHGMTRS